jgi:hypothetical protein
MDLSVAAQGPSVAERARMLDQMRQVSDRFYAAAVAIKNHAFIEFNGLIVEYITLCQRAHDQGIDFTRCNIHTGTTLPMEPFNVDYISEKLGCIFSGQITAAAQHIAPVRESSPNRVTL